ncbi:MAG: BrnT family toxin [Nitrospirae bacterium]|nr:BrnT family toxin [Nitrospirota bacterium]
MNGITYYEEERFILLGMSYTLRILVVCKDEVIRIISARRAARAEQKCYWKGVVK